MLGHSFGYDRQEDDYQFGVETRWFRQEAGRDEQIDTGRLMKLNLSFQYNHKYSGGFFAVYRANLYPDKIDKVNGHDKLKQQFTVYARYAPSRHWEWTAKMGSFAYNAEAAKHEAEYNSVLFGLVINN